jgi:hypothetical protein
VGESTAAGRARARALGFLVWARIGRAADAHAPRALSSPQANCIDSTSPAEAVFAREVKKLQEEKFRPLEQLTLEPYERDHAIVVGTYRAPKKKKDAA